MGGAPATMGRSCAMAAAGDLGYPSSKGKRSQALAQPPPAPPVMARALDSLLATRRSPMHKRIAAVTVAMLAVALPTFAATKSGKTSKETTTSTAKPAAHTVSGTLASYDAAAKTLTVKGGSNTWTFDTGSARVWEGSKSVDLDELSSHSGAKVTVKYTEQYGHKAAESVRLAPAHVKTASKSK
jgi:hypothetical protein